MASAFLRSVRGMARLPSCLAPRSSALLSRPAASLSARSLASQFSAPSTLLQQQQRQHRPCQCCRPLHTEGDKQLAEFLSQEIANEKAEAGQQQLPPSLDGFSVLASGNDVTLTKQAGGETVKLVWNVAMAGMEYDEMDELDEHVDGQDAPSAVAMPPNLMVLLNKGRGSTLMVHVTPSPAAAQPGEPGQQQEEDADPVAIIDAGLVASAEAQGDYIDLEQKLMKSYKVAGNDMDQNMYYLLVNCLIDRGLTQEFISKLLDVHSHYEHSQYVQFLERLKAFNSS